MSQCSNCYNGCVEITSDKCVKYTGVNVPLLDIKTGDSLSWVEQALISFLTATIDGSGIQITLNDEDYCDLVSNYLEACETVTALELFRALVKAACDLQGQINTINAELVALNSEYDVDCLDGVTSESQTHDVVQAIITKLCAVDETLTALAIDLETNYVKLADLDALIAAYIAGTGTSTRYYSRMVPYVAYEYYGPVTGFDATGAGIADTEWEDIYLCNGDNGTPDKRGRVAVGATNTPGVLPLDAAVDPVNPGNPAYTVSDTTNGQNTVTLTEDEIPAHTHVATAEPHTHDYLITPSGADSPNGVANYPVTNSTTDGASDPETENMIGLVVQEAEVPVSNANTGGGEAHINYQPGIGCYYIMYIPS